MEFMFLTMKGSTILSVDFPNLEREELTIEQAAERMVQEIAEQTGERPTGYAVLGVTSDAAWVLQQTKKVRGEIFDD